MCDDQCDARGSATDGKCSSWNKLIGFCVKSKPEKSQSELVRFTPYPVSLRFGIKMLMCLLNVYL